MRKIRMCVPVAKTFAVGFEEYILDCKSRNLRDGTIRHYRESIKQIYKAWMKSMLSEARSLKQERIRLVRY